MREPDNLPAVSNWSQFNAIIHQSFTMIEIVTLRWTADQYEQSDIYYSRHTDYLQGDPGDETEA